MIKKIIINIAIVGVVVFVLDFAIGRTLRYFYFKESSGQGYRSTFAMEKTEAAILVFGSSPAAHHYIPEIFEHSLKMNFYNTGKDGEGTFYQLAVLRSVLKRYKPKIIIFDWSGTFLKDKFSYDGLSSLLPYYRTHPEIRDIVEFKSKFEKVKLLSEIYPFNSELLTIILGNLNLNKKRMPDDKGYVALYKEWQAKIHSALPYNKYPADPIKVKCFREFIIRAKESGAKIFVVYSPIFRIYTVNQEFEICNNICAMEKVPVWNFTSDTTFLKNNHLFQDIAHLNYKGAVIFSKLILEKMKRVDQVKTSRL